MQRIATLANDHGKPGFDGFSRRVAEGSDEDRLIAFSRWLKRLRTAQPVLGESRDDG